MSDRLTDEVIEMMRDAVREATDGRWWVLGFTVVDDDPNESISPPGMICDCYGGESAKWNSQYIATFDPPTVCRLIDEIERLRAENRQLKAYEEGEVVDGTPCCGAEHYTGLDLKAGTHERVCFECGERFEEDTND